MKGYMTPEEEIVAAYQRNKGFVLKTLKECRVARPRLRRILKERGLME